MGLYGDIGGLYQHYRGIIRHGSMTGLFIACSALLLAIGLCPDDPRVIQGLEEGRTLQAQEQRRIKKATEDARLNKPYDYVRPTWTPDSKPRP
ncbi:MAG: hypothetical protein ISS48_01905 [Candidatus Aenigmarchaeota archaeon]|nr:hypothetical protein [Candidatus Aenigmarchaeota archaeon]